MEKPFLEISVVSCQDETFSEIEFLQKAEKNLLEYSPVSPIHNEITSKPSLLLIFQTVDDFSAMYDKDYAIYSYLYDNILHNNLEFGPQIFSRKDDNFKNSHYDKHSDELSPNYLVLRYKSNYLAPMRRNYNLVYKVNEIIGSYITHEEVNDGFLRFIKTERDYKSMFLGNDEVQKWIDFFELFAVDISHPTIVKFLEIIKSYLKN